MFECPHRSILCPAQNCQFINNVEIVIIHSINCNFHLLYCAICKSMYNVSVLTHDWNVIKSQSTIDSGFKYYHNISQPNHSHKDAFLITNWYIETFESWAKINYDMFMSEALIKPPPTAMFTTRQILQRQNAFKDLSFSTYNNLYLCYFSFCISYCYWYILLCKYFFATQVDYFNY